MPTGMVRPKNGRWLGGVCAAVSRQYGFDVNLVRLLVAVLSALTAGSVVPILYIVGWVLIPQEGSAKAGGRQPSGDPRIAPAPPVQSWQQSWQQQRQPEQQQDYR